MVSPVTPRTYCMHRSLRDVSMDDYAYPCAVYVLRRTGSSLTVSQLMEIEAEPYTDEFNLNVGDILVWQHRMKRVANAMLNIVNKGIITTKVQVNKHFGVYEGWNFLSDVTFDKGAYFPCIRSKRMQDCDTPTHVIRSARLHPEMK